MSKLKNPGGCDVWVVVPVAVPEFKIAKPNNLEINGLSNFLTDTTSLDVKIANKDIVLFKGFDENKNYSESGIINRKSGELVHEVTREIKSETPEKDITFYNCTEKNRVV